MTPFLVYFWMISLMVTGQGLEWTKVRTTKSLNFVLLEFTFEVRVRGGQKEEKESGGKGESLSWTNTKHKMLMMTSPRTIFVLYHIVSQNCTH